MHEHTEKKSLSFAILTVSDTRTFDTDKSGQTIRHYLEEDGHYVKHYTIVHDEMTTIQHTIKQWSLLSDVHVIIVTGGTGLTKRDITYEALTSLFEKEMVGFGEYFRKLSYKDIGLNGMFSRASAGCINEKAIYSLPGSVGAVTLGVQEIILPSVHHFLWELKR